VTCEEPGLRVGRGPIRQPPYSEQEKERGRQIT
jgi:hypothetical protein